MSWQRALYDESERVPQERYCRDCLQRVDETEHSLLFYCTVCSNYIQRDHTLDEERVKYRELEIAVEIGMEEKR